MIAHVFGKAVEKFGSSIIVDVGGIGYEVQVATGDYEKISIDQDVKLYTHHHIREQSQELFGFSSLMAKKLFELLIISGFITTSFLSVTIEVNLNFSRTFPSIENLPL